MMTMTTCTFILCLIFQGAALRLPASGIADQNSRRYVLVEEGCLQDMEQRPNGIMKTHLGKSLPTSLKVDNITGIQLRGAQCQKQNGGAGCGMLDFKHPLREHKCVKQVAKIIHFIWLDNALPLTYAKNILNVHEKNPDYQIMLWVNEKATDISALGDLTLDPEKFRVNLLEQHGHPWINWDFYEKEPGVGARSSLMRLEVIYLYGGIYMDTDSRAIHGFDEYGSVFRWPFVTMGTQAYGNLCNCLFSAEKGSGLLKFTMDAWRDIHLNHNVPTRSPHGSGILTAAFMVYNDPQIMMLDSDHMLHSRKDTK